MTRSGLHPAKALWLLAVSLLWAAVAFVSIAASAADAETDVRVARIGVLAERGERHCRQQWGPTAEYLTRNVPGCRFLIVPLDFDDLDHDASLAKIDFVLWNPVGYVRLEQLRGACCVATLKRLQAGRASVEFSGIIFCRADRRDLSGYHSLRGKTFMAVDRDSLGGWIAAWRELNEQGIHPETYFRALRFGGTHDAVIDAVLAGEVDAGTVRTDTLEQMVKAGKVRLSDLRFLCEHGSAPAQHESVHATRSYPEWPMARLPHTANELSDRVSMALMSMPSDSEAARAAGCAGWTTPRNYQSVHACLHELRLPPYQDAGKQSIGETIRDHWPWLAGIAAILTMMAVFTAYVGRLNRRLHVVLDDRGRELTQRIQTEEALRQAEKEKDAILTGMGEMIVEYVDPEMRIIWANSFVCENYAKPGEDIRGRHCYEVIQGRDSPCVNCSAVAAVRSGNREQGEVSTPDGRAWMTRSNPLKDLDGRVTGVLQCAVDITRRKLMEEDLQSAEEAVRRENAKLSAMISGMKEGVVFADSNNVIVEVNDFYCRFVRTARGDILGKRIEAFHGPQVLGRLLGHIDRFRAEPGCEAVVVQRAILGAELIVRLQPVYRDGLYDGVLLNVIDVTELVKARRQAEAATEAKSKFLAAMSHEIRTPLTAILGYADLLADFDVPQETRDEHLAVIRRNGKHLLGLINDILDLSKIEAGRVTLSIQPCNVASAVNDIAEMMRPGAQQRRSTIHVEFDSNLPETIPTDPTRLRQALANLVGNAVKFTENGTVRIRTSFLPNWRNDRPAVRIDVIDTGIGIRKEILPRLFRPFNQGDVSTGDKFGGTGLGLAITRHILDLLGGELKVTSTFGEGSTFTIIVPASDARDHQPVDRPGEPTEEPEPAAGPPAADALKGVRILLAEDGLDNQRLIRMMLAKVGAHVDVAENGRIAFEKATSQPFDIILMDVNMPEMDGYEATRALRGRGFDRPILALTAHAMADDRERSLAAGCNEHLLKPIDQAHMIRTIARCCDRNGEKEIPAPCRVPCSPERSEAEHPHDERKHGAGRAEEPQAAASDAGVLRSEYADDPDISTILDEFIDGLAAQIQEMQGWLAEANFPNLQRGAHRIKGSGGGYGYPVLTEAAKSLEDAAKACDQPTAAVRMNRVAALCEAIQRGRNGASSA